jgi:hypothetical protein
MTFNQNQLDKSLKVIKKKTPKLTWLVFKLCISYQVNGIKYLTFDQQGSCAEVFFNLTEEIRSTQSLNNDIDYAFIGVLNSPVYKKSKNVQSVNSDVELECNWSFLIPDGYITEIT